MCLLLRLPLLLLLCGTFVTLGQAQQTIRITDNDLLPNNEYRWTADNIYLLDGLVFLEAGGKLSIEAGTIIKASATPSTGDVTSALIISRAAQLEAIGSPLHPIVFTAETDDIENPSDLQLSDRGLWGGLILLGAAPINAEQPSNYLAGLTSGQPKSSFGGDDPNDQSGILRYISIRHAGAGGFAGLTLAGIGRSTIIRHIEVFSAAKDGIRFLGGNARSQYMAVAFCGEDQFEWDLGFRGKGENWFSIHAEDAGDQAVEGRGGFDKTIDKVSNPEISFSTFIGPGNNASFSIPSALYFHEGSAGSIGKSIITEFPNLGLEVEDLEEDFDALSQMEACQLIFYDNTWWALGESQDLFSISQSSSSINNVVSSLHHFLTPYGNSFKSPMLASISRTLQDDFFLDPTINDLCGEFMPGAFQSYWWLDQWAALTSYGFLPSCEAPMFFEPELPLNTMDTIPITDYQQLIDLRKSRINGRLEIRFCPSCIEYISSPTLATSVRRDRTRRRASAQKLFSVDDFCWLEEWRWTYYLYEGEGNTPPQSEVKTPVDSIIVSRFFTIDDTEPPQLTLVPNGSLSPMPFEVITFDNDTVSVNYRTEQSQGSSQLIHIWTATDFCGNASSYTIMESTISTNPDTWYLDRDGDGFGDPSTGFIWPNRPNQDFVNQGGDCHDQDANFTNNCENFTLPDICRLAESLVIGELSPSYSSMGTSLNPNLPHRCNESRPVGDLWFQLIAPSAGQLNIKTYDIISNNLTSLELYTGSCDNLELLNFSCDGKLVNLGLTPGQHLWLRVLVEESHEFTLLPYIPAPPSNDFCSGAIELSASSSCTLVPYTIGLPNFAGYHTPPLNTSSGGDIWFKTTIPPSGVLEINTDAYVEVYAGNCDELLQIPTNYAPENEFAEIKRSYIVYRPENEIYIRAIVDSEPSDTLQVCVIATDIIPFRNNNCQDLEVVIAESCLAFSSPSPTNLCLTTNQDCQVDFEYSLQFIETCTEDTPKDILVNISLDQDSDGSLDQQLVSELSTTILSWPQIQLAFPLPIGEHILWVQWKQEYESSFTPPSYHSVSIPLTVEDCSVPTLSCISGLAVELLPASPNNPIDADSDGTIDIANMQVFAADFVANSTEPCTSTLDYALYRKSTLIQSGILTSDGSYLEGWSPALTQDTESIYLNCSDTSQVVEVILFAIASSGQWVECSSQILVQDNIGACQTHIPSSLIRGIVRTKDGETVEGVTVQLSGDQEAITTTNAAGQYSFEGLIPGLSYTITPFKNDDPLNGVSTLDLDLMTQHILGLQPYDEPSKWVAADVNKDGQATTLDIIQTRRLILGSTDNFPNNSSWRFITAFYTFPESINPLSINFPENQSLVNLPEAGLSGINFEAIKIGDINNSARKNNEQIIVRNQKEPLSLLVYGSPRTTSGTISLAFSLPADEKCIGFQGTIGFDTKALSFIDIRYDLATNNHFGWQASENGRISISWNHSDLPSTANHEKEKLFTLDFMSTNKNLAPSRIWLDSKITPIEAYDKNGNTRDLQLVFIKDRPAPPELQANIPNPFSEQTQIKYYLPIAQEIKFQIVDVKGKLIHQEEGWRDAGYHTLSILAQDLSGTGLYFYRLNTGSYSAIRRMILIK